MDRPAIMPAPASGAAGTPSLQADGYGTVPSAVDGSTAEASAFETFTVEGSTVEDATVDGSTVDDRAADRPAGLTRAPKPEDGHGGGHHVFELPRIPALLMHALPRFVEGVIAPVVVFYVALMLLGLTGALVAAVAWVYGGIVYRYVRGHPVSGMLLLAAVGVTVRAGLSAATGSAVVYFLQPTLGTLCVSMAFLASVPLGKPLAMKLAKDMAPIPDAFYKHDRVRRFFLRISLLWSAVLMANVGVSLWMLFSQSISMYLWIRTGVVAGLGAAGIAASVWGFKRVVRHVNREPAEDAAAA
ncbi:intracellular septation protein A [Actinomadura catellatispora]|uniref:Intracellular septation protein A n=3 Tax=Actinomadura livida TaxID=79909 RepID=A0A7W7IDG4_9ACTN|nr:intracellular septation protein A [Actinomadura catellatispora]